MKNKYYIIMKRNEESGVSEFKLHQTTHKSLSFEGRGHGYELLGVDIIEIFYVVNTEYCGLCDENGLGNYPYPTIHTEYNPIHGPILFCNRDMDNNLVPLNKDEVIDCVNTIVGEHIHYGIHNGILLHENCRQKIRRELNKLEKESK